MLIVLEQRQTLIFIQIHQSTGDHIGVTLTTDKETSAVWSKEVNNWDNVYQSGHLGVVSMRPSDCKNGRKRIKFLENLLNCRHWISNFK